MKTFRNILLTGFFSLILICLLIFFFAKTYLTPEVIKTSFSYEIKKQLGRDVSFSDIEVDMLKGINLKGVVIHKSLPWETRDILSCEEIHLKFRLAPVLIKKLLIKNIDVKKPVINIQFADGHPVRLRGRVRASGENSRQLNTIFLPGLIKIRDGLIKFNDLSNNFSFSLADIQIKADNISLLFPFKFTASANLQGNKKSDILCRGTFSIPKNKLTADITTGNIPLSAFKDYLNARNIPIQGGLLKLKVNIKTDGSPSTVKFNGNTILKNASFTGKTSTTTDKQLKMDGINTTLSFQSVLDISRKILTINKMQGKFLFSKYSGKGIIRKKNGANFININLNSDRFYIDDFFSRIHKNQSYFTDGLKLAGDIGLKVNIQGRLDRPVFPTVMVKLKNNRLLYPPFGSLHPVLNGDLRIEKDNISVAGLKISTNNLSYTLSGDISGYRHWPPKSSLKIISSSVNLYGLFNPSASEPMEEIGPFDLPGVSFDGPIKLGIASFLGMRLSNVHGSYLFKNNKLHIKNLKGNIGEGSFNFSTTIDLGVKGLDYYLYLKLDAVPLKSIMSLFPAYNSSHIDGTISATCAFKGTGTDPAVFTDKLKGDAFLSLNNGNINGLTFLPQLSYFIKSEELEKINFEKANLQLKLRKGIIDLDGAFINPKIELHPSGEVGIDSSLDLEATLKISPELFTNSTKLADYLPQEDGWITLPVNIDGTLQDPNVSLSRETMNYILKDTLPKLLMDILSTKTDTSTEDAPEDISDGEEEKRK